jgi:hypothetical protein
MENLREELRMDYSPILGVTYGLKNVVVDEEEWDEDHALSLVLNGILEDLEEDEKKEE